MVDIARLTLAIVLMAGLVGCGSADSSNGAVAKQAADETTTASSGVEKSLVAADTPAAVVNQFLESVRSGNEQQASNLLTQVARDELAKSGWEVQPPGTPTSTYVVGRTEILSDGQGAYVSSEWTEANENGQSATYEVVWVLRQQTDGWRVAGMATEAIPGEDPVFFSFEHPQDMQKKREAAAAAMAARQQAELRQATKPATPAPALR